MTTRFQCLVSSDESDHSDGEIVDRPSALTNAFGQEVPEGESETNNNNNTTSVIKPSSKLEIVDGNKDALKKKKFSIWSEILMEEELNETMSKSLVMKKKRLKRRMKANCGERESDNYHTWTKEDFERKFAVKKTPAQKLKQKKAQLKRDAITEISQKLKERRLDIIGRIVKVIGEEAARRLTAEVLDIEDAGGMMTANGNRRRSPGGVLFFLVKNDSTISDEKKRDIFCDELVKEGNKIDREVRKSRAEAASKRSKGKKKKKSKKKGKGKNKQGNKE